MDEPPARAREPDEDEYPGLTILLDALQLLDHGLSQEVSAQEQQRGVRVGCHAGCTACCQRNVRLRSIEIEGIVWYAATRLDEPTWRRVKAQLARPHGPACPLLLDGQCSVRPVRPIVCRTFFVFGEPCKVGERLLQERSGDIFEHSEQLHERVALRLFDDESFGLSSDDEKRDAYRRGAMYSSALSMEQVDWVTTIDALRDELRSAPPTDEG